MIDTAVCGGMSCVEGIEKMEGRLGGRGNGEQGLGGKGKGFYLSGDGPSSSGSECLGKRTAKAQRGREEVEVEVEERQLQID